MLLSSVTPSQRQAEPTLAGFAAMISISAERHNCDCWQVAVSSKVSALAYGRVIQQTNAHLPQGLERSDQAPYAVGDGRGENTGRGRRLQLYDGS